ncbi:MAG: tRNA (guanosine(46)-N7)-methyltransferase TrmB, partial [Verrucomicrobiota bacterium]|nr:tRNA (guanosine(46)-N7)-methyltransferase TrmB [Verrucomicrobiota bacterium]
SYVASLDLPKIFGRDAPLHVDLGCGDGSFLCALAQRMPEKNFLGVERLLGRVRSAARKAAKIGNVRVLRLETSYAVRYLLPPDSVESFYLLFPDPWPKRRHQRRRIMTPDFLSAVGNALVDNGTFRIATDQTDYFEQTRELAEQSTVFVATKLNGDDSFPPSTFEKKFKTNGTRIYRLELRKTSPVM